MRQWIANALARLARRIYPQSAEVQQFYADRMMDLVLTGNSFIKVERLDPKDVVLTRAAPSTGSQSK